MIQRELHLDTSILARPTLWRKIVVVFMNAVRSIAGVVRRKSSSETPKRISDFICGEKSASEEVV